MKRDSDQQLTEQRNEWKDFRNKPSIVASRLKGVLDRWLTATSSSSPSHRETSRISLRTCHYRKVWTKTREWQWSKGSMIDYSQWWWEVVQNKVGHHGREDDRQRCRETFDNVVGIFNHSSNNQTTNSLSVERRESRWRSSLGSLTWRKITVHTTIVYPWKKPLSITAL